jgi:hypothetical protein
MYTKRIGKVLQLYIPHPCPLSVTITLQPKQYDTSVPHNTVIEYDITQGLVARGPGLLVKIHVVPEKEQRQYGERAREADQSSDTSHPVWANTLNTRIQKK